MVPPKLFPLRYSLSRCPPNFRGNFAFTVSPTLNGTHRDSVSFRLPMPVTHQRITDILNVRRQLHGWFLRVPNAFMAYRCMSDRKLRGFLAHTSYNPIFP